MPTLILEADVSPQARDTHKDAVSVMQQGKLVHIDGAGHNLHPDEFKADSRGGQGVSFNTFVTSYLSKLKFRQ